MLRYALIALVVAVIAAALGLGGIVPFALNLAYLFVILAVILFIWHLVTGKKV